MQVDSLPTGDGSSWWARGAVGGRVGGGWRAESLEGKHRNGSVSPRTLEPRMGRGWCSELPRRQRESWGREHLARPAHWQRGWPAPAWAWWPWGWGTGVPGREAPGGESFQAGWGFWPWESRPYPGAWSRVGTIGGHTGWGAPGLPQRAPRTPLLFLLPAGPRPKDDVTSAAGTRGLAWAPHLNPASLRTSGSPQGH